MVEIPPPRERHAEHAVRLRLIDPAVFRAPPALDRFWQPVHMVANLPHLHARFTAGASPKPVPDPSLGAGAVAPARALRQQHDGAPGGRVGPPGPLGAAGEPVGGPVAVAGPRSGGSGAVPAAAAAGAAAVGEGGLWLGLGLDAADGGGAHDKGGSQSALFMLDSGAGGVDVMFHERASLMFGLLEGAGVKTRFIRARAWELPLARYRAWRG